MDKQITHFTNGQWLLIHIIALLFFFPALLATVPLYFMQKNAEQARLAGEEIEEAEVIDD